MDTNLMIETVFYLGISALTIITVVLTIVYIMRLPSSKGIAKKNSESNEGIKKLINQGNAENAIPKDLFENEIPKQAVSPVNKLFEMEPVVVEVLPETNEITETAPLEKSESQPKMEIVTYINRKPDEQKSGKLVPVESMKQTIAFEDKSINCDTIPIAAPVDLDATEPKSEENNNHNLSQADTLPLIESNETVLVSKTNIKIKEIEPNMDNKHSKEVKKASPEPSAVTANPGNNSKDVSQTKNPSMGDLSDLFAKSGSENIETNKLATELNHVDVNDLLHEGNLILEKLKKFSR